jgi:hypothetical protein
MLLAVATTTGLVIWIVLWALGIKSVDAFLITILIVLVAATGQIAARYMPGGRRS